jgi:2-keto-4-pentenoate hydratase/2-oxohepta-3-ene-1,7-dioic acid hydratase in catechol pathway
VKLVTYHFNGKTAVGAVLENGVVDLSAIAPDMVSLIELGPKGIEQASTLGETAAITLPLEAVRLLAPIPSPRRNIMCLGLNYSEHVAESYSARGQETQHPEYPVIFTKATTTINGPYDDIPFDAAVSEEMDWEVELAIIIGRSGKNIPLEQALAYVFGYTILNDVSARDLQWQHKQFFKGKSLDGCCPMGPWIVTADTLPTPQELRVTSRVNGVTKQDSNTSYMIFDIPAVINHLSHGMTLLAGDIIATGTPSGVGFARQPPEFLRPGDVVECEIEGIGAIRNSVAVSK